MDKDFVIVIIKLYKKEKTNNQIKHFTRKLGPLKKNQIKILEPKSKLYELTNSVNGFSNR